MPKLGFLFLLVLRFIVGAGIAQSVWRQAGPEGPGDDALLHRVQTSSGSHPASYPLVTVGYFPGNKAART
jgi:hypothetical protein